MKDDKKTKEADEELNQDIKKDQKSSSGYKSKIQKKLKTHSLTVIEEEHGEQTGSHSIINEESFDDKFQGITKRSTFKKGETIEEKLV